MIAVQNSNSEKDKLFKYYVTFQITWTELTLIQMIFYFQNTKTLEVTIIEFDNAKYMHAAKILNVSIESICILARSITTKYQKYHMGFSARIEIWKRFTWKTMF